MRDKHMTMRVAAAVLLAPSLLAGCGLREALQAVGSAFSGSSERAVKKIRFTPLVQYPARAYDADGSLQICGEGIQFTARAGWWVPISYSSIWFAEVDEGVFLGIDTLYVYASDGRWTFQVGAQHDATAIANTIRKRAASGPQWTSQPLARYESVRWNSFGHDATGRLAVHAEGIRFEAGPSVVVRVPYSVMWSVDSKEGYWRRDTLHVEAPARTFRFKLPRQTDVTALAGDIRQRAGL